MAKDKKVALIIDDNQANLTIIQRALQQLGFNVTTVNHPNRINATLEAMNDIDIIFLDIEMPTMDGYKVHQKLTEFGIQAPIIAHTVHTDEINLMRATGFKGIIGKPLDIDQLPQRIDDILSGTNRWLT
jgi:two-component system capsular synthesis sensor histidine kinase RcsC